MSHAVARSSSSSRRGLPSLHFGRKGTLAWVLAVALGLRHTGIYPPQDSVPLASLRCLRKVTHLLHMAERESQGEPFPKAGSPWAAGAHLALCHPEMQKGVPEPCNTQPSLPGMAGAAAWHGWGSSLALPVCFSRSLKPVQGVRSRAPRDFSCPRGAGQTTQLQLCLALDPSAHSSGHLWCLPFFPFPPGWQLPLPGFTPSTHTLCPGP